MTVKSPENMVFLIVEDQYDLLQSIKDTLNMLKYSNVHGVSSAKKAWDFLNKKGSPPVDCILAEYDMKEINGLELLIKLRESKKFRDIPYLMIIGDVDRTLVAEAAEHDVDGYVTKPFIAATFEQKIKEVIEKIHNPEPLTIHLRNARDQEDAGNLKASISELGKAMTANPGSSRPLRELGRIYIKQGNTGKAISCFQKALQLNCLDVGSYHYLGQLYIRNGKIDDATNCFSRAMDISPRHSNRAMKLVHLLLQKRRHSDAERVLEVILKNNPDNIAVQEEIAETSLENNLAELAAKSMKIILKRKPGRLDIHKKIGLLYHQRGQHKDAARHLNKASKEYGADLDLMLALAKSFFAMDRIGMAEKWVNNAKKLFPDNRDVIKLLKKC